MVELTVVEEDVGVGVGGDGEGALADPGADEGPGFALAVPDALQARAIAVRRRSWVKPGNTGRSGTRSSRGGSVEVTAANRSGGSETQRPRRPFSTARRMRQ